YFGVVDRGFQVCLADHQLLLIFSTLRDVAYDGDHVRLASEDHPLRGYGPEEYFAILPSEMHFPENTLPRLICLHERRPFFRSRPEFKGFLRGAEADHFFGSKSRDFLELLVCFNKD